jgi:hypothetical protein
LFADVFPNTPSGDTPPAALLQAFDRDKTVFYHWEITPTRLKSLPALAQLGLLLTRQQQLLASSAADQWLNQIAPTLGPSITEVYQTGPSELTFMRTARAGLTAVELTALANWLEAPNFPSCDLNLPPPEAILDDLPEKKLSAPTATH